LLRAKDLNRRVTSEEFHYYRCKACRTVFLDPVPEELGRYYPAGYHAVPGTLAELQPFFEPEAYKVETLTRFAEGPRVLEIGPSIGVFAYLAKQASWDVHVIEMDPACSAFLRDQVGVKVYNSSDVPWMLGRVGEFDVVALWHSLEHMPDPWSVLDRVQAVLSRRGVLVLATPNPESLQFGMFGPYWVHLDAPRHVSLIPAATLVQRLKAQGLEIELITTEDRGAHDCNELGWQVSPLHFLRTESPFDFLQAKPIERLFRMFGHGLGKVLSRAESREGRGTAYTAVFRRR